MKTIMKCTLVATFMLSAITASASEVRFNVFTDSPKNVIVKIDTRFNEANVRLTNKYNNVIFSEEVPNTKTYFKKLNMENLENGIYLLTAENTLRAISYRITVFENEVKVSDRKENVKPVFRKSGAKVYLNLLNLEKSKVDIKVYDSENRLVFSEVSKNELIVEKAFNFENAYKDSYTVVVKDNLNTYYEDIVVK
ncbi:hypothetical protein [Costertonia aggregata]|uniref:Por secretion system C-terminal sorting domain-containing protein n=1 Tax=Costertonia aggregata TaxID=343403 RepID=A0A7H9ALG4_9FLAO|nr:hypothetical protein [Costertonia aggregata]QLG44213.1 hypothetical protein HYG79_02230 [Costertonia aggregata]